MFSLMSTCFLAPNGGHLPFIHNDTQQYAVNRYYAWRSSLGRKTCVRITPMDTRTIPTSISQFRNSCRKKCANKVATKGVSEENAYTRATAIRRNAVNMQ